MSDSPLTLTEDDKNRLFTAIGSVVVRFQQIELWQSEILAKQLALDVLNDRYVLMASMSFKQKIDLLMVLCKRNPNDFRNIDFQLVKVALNRDCPLESLPKCNINSQKLNVTNL